jgi:hypothetical protein
VGTKPNNWEVKELLPEEDRRNTVYNDAMSDYTGSMYFQQPTRASHYGSSAY